MAAGIELAERYASLVVRGSGGQARLIPEL